MLVELGRSVPVKSASVLEVRRNGEQQAIEVEEGAIR